MAYLFTSESVSEGHPDKVADQISDALIDHFMAFDPTSKVACETLVTTGQVVLAGEVNTTTYLDVQAITRKVTRAAARIALGLDTCLYLGNLNAQRDWGHAKDYVEAMWRILQQDVAEDYVIAMGETTYVRDFVRMAFAELGIAIEFKGEGVNEKGYVLSCSNAAYQLETGRQVIAVDPKYFRPTEVDLLIGDPSKSKTKLGWVPQYDLAGLVKEMITADVASVKKEIMLKKSIM